MPEKKKEGFSPPALGGSSLLVVFAVLALTVFALLSLSTVRADVGLGDSAAQAVKDYYAADGKAQEVLALLRNGQAPEDIEVKEIVAEYPDRIVKTCSYVVPISDTQELQVDVELDGSQYTVLRWQAAPCGEWNADFSLDLWDGELVFEW